MKTITSLLTASLLLATSSAFSNDLRIGIIGLDTSHVIAFTKTLNDPKDKNHVAGGKVVAAFKGGSKDVEASWSRVDKYTEDLQKNYGVKIYASIEAMCKDVDVVMLESVDGRPHLAQARPVIKAGKPLFIDKPMAGSLRDVLEIFRLAKKNKVPVFSASSLRYGKNTQAVRNGSVGKVLGAWASSPVNVEPHHPELFWYGVHGVESLFTVMGAGCETVKRGKTEDGRIEVTGTWSDGRIGIFREGGKTKGNKPYGGVAKGEKGEADIGISDGYAPLLVEVIKFFQTGVPPVPERETIEIFAFMTASDESKKLGGQPISIPELLKKNGGN